MLPRFLDQGRGLLGPGKIVRDVDAKEFETYYTLHCISADIDGDVAPNSPEAHNDLMMIALFN